MKYLKGDEIIVTSGRDKSKKGKIQKIIPGENSVVVEGVNLYKKHTKSQGQNKPGGIVDIIKPLNVAKIALLCPRCHKQTRIGIRREDDLRKRYCKKCKQEI